MDILTKNVEKVTTRDFHNVMSFYSDANQCLVS